VRDLFSIASKFVLEGNTTNIKPLGEGFINDTFMVYVDNETEPKYILQRKNHIVFPDVPAMMQNIKSVTEHIKGKVNDPLRETLTVIPTYDGNLYYKDEDGNFWAVCLYIGGTMCYDKADTPELAYQGGSGLGKFHKLVSDYNGTLTEVIKGFHNIRWRFQQWDTAIKEDRANRVCQLTEEIRWIESRREKMMDFYQRIESGEIPSRVSHNDTKISNFLFNKSDGSLLCAIDLDTMMSSTLLNDVGDALRSYTNTGAEDEKDLRLISMSMDMFKAYIEGYLSEMASSLTKEEVESLAFSGCLITFEQVLRFLMDYIDGDKYYKIAYPDHNLVRTKAQYALLLSMEAQLDKANCFVQECINKYK